MSKLKVTANFQKSKILGKVTIESTNLKFISVGRSETEDISRLFDTNENPNSIANYADGTHASLKKIAQKIDVWGGREDNGEALRAFIVYKNSGRETSHPIGFVNLGVNAVNANNIELGIFFSDKMFSNQEDMALIYEAVRTAAKDYPEYIKSNSQLMQEKHFVFFDTSYQLLQSVVQESGFSKINSLNELCEVFGQNTNVIQVKERFTEQDGMLHDNGRVVSIFYNKLCQEADILGVDNASLDYD